MTAQKYNKSEIMKEAHKLYKEANVTVVHSDHV